MAVDDDNIRNFLQDLKEKSEETGVVSATLEDKIKKYSQTKTPKRPAVVNQDVVSAPSSRPAPKVA